MNNEDLDALLVELECIVCTDYMQPPIRLCKRGHSICNECASKLIICPTCQVYIVDDSRNYALEKLAEKFVQQIPCRNRERGCDFCAINANTLAQHRTECSFNERQCVFAQEYKCEWRGIAVAMRDHCLEAHKQKTKTVPQWNFYFNDFATRTSNYKLHSFVFYVYGQVFKFVENYNSTTGYRRWCVLHLSSDANTSERTNNYTCKLTFFDKGDGTGKTMFLCGPCPSVPFGEITDDELENYWLYTSMRYLKNFCKSSKLSYRLNIIKPDDNE